MKIAVITGASSGLGKVFSEKVLARYPKLDEVWLIARREKKLQELASRYPERKFRALPLDLSNTSSYEQLDALLHELKPEVKILINNAGFEREGLFREMSSADILAMINLNITGMTMVNRCFLPYMKRGSYEIITGSVSSFVPVPWQAVYSASKAYVRFFARAVREEEKKRGVHILLLCPGNMETEMNVKSAATGKISRLPYLDLQKETVKAMKKAEKGAAVYTPLAFYKAYRVFGKIVPSAVAVKFTSIEKGGTANR